MTASGHATPDQHCAAAGEDESLVAMDTERTFVDFADLVAPDRFGTHGHPHATFTLLRRTSPVHWCEPDRYPGFWAVTRHRDVKEISLDYERFSSRGPVLLAPLTARPVEESLLGRACTRQVRATDSVLQCVAQRTQKRSHAPIERKPRPARRSPLEVPHEPPRSH